MFRKVAILVLVLAALLGGILLYAAYNIKDLAAKYKPRLEQVAGSAINAHVSLGEIDISVFPSVFIQTDQARISRTAAAEESLSLNRLRLHIKLMPLLGGRLEIDELELVEPNVTVLKTDQGTYLAGLPPAAKKEQPESKPAAPKQSSPVTGKQDRAANFSFTLRSFRIVDGLVAFKDETADKLYQISKLNMNAGVNLDGSLVEAGRIDLTGRLLDTADFGVKILDLSFDLNSNEAVFPNIEIQLPRSTVKIAGRYSLASNAGEMKVFSEEVSLKGITPLLKAAIPAELPALEGGVALDVAVSMESPSEYSASGQVGLSKISIVKDKIGITGLNGRIDIDADTIQQKAESQKMDLLLNGTPVSLSFKGNHRQQKAVLEELNLTAFSGSATATGTFDIQSKGFSATVRAADISLEQAATLAVEGVNQKIEGKLQSLQAELTGIGDDSIRKTLRGSTSFTLVDGRLKDVNLLSEVLGSLKNLPFLAGSLKEMVPPNLQPAISAQDTKIDKLEMRARIADEELYADMLNLEAPELLLKATGAVGFQGRLNLNSSIEFSQTLSTALSTKVRELERILSSDKTLIIPLTVTGTVPRVIVVPDVKKLVETGARRAIEEQAGKILQEKGGKLLEGFLGF